MTTAVQLAQSVAPGVSLGFKNRIINGDMRIDQRNAGASVSATNGGYTLDRYVAISYDSGAVTGKFTVQQNAGSVTPPNDFKNYLGVTSSAATTVNANTVFAISQTIEGLNISDLNWGSASASAVTLSFWVRSSITGQHGGSLMNSDGNYNYPFAYTISSANTWEYKTITIAGPTSGTWLTTNGAGISIRFGLGAGATWTEPAGAWTTSLAYSADGCVNVVSTNGATFYITGVQLEVGTAATSFEYRDYGRELIMCQRYYQKIGGTADNALGSFAQWAANYGFSSLQIPTMRAAPSFSYSNLSEFTALCAGNTSSLISFYCPSITPSNMEIIFNNSTGFVAGYASWLRMNTSSTYVSLSAEL